MRKTEHYNNYAEPQQWFKYNNQIDCTRRNTYADKFFAKTV